MVDKAIAEFRAALRSATSVMVLSGAGVSAESGVPTFRGAGGLWRRWSATELATPEAWARDAGLVWEFYDYRRRRMADVQPNPAHHALAAFEARWSAAGRELELVTQNIDGLHEQAGSRAVTRLHGSIWHVRCLRCGAVTPNRDVPITPAYEGAGDPDPHAHARRFTADDLPRCACSGILRPHVVWFGESLAEEDLGRAVAAAERCDALIVVGTSAVVYPAAGLIPLARRSGAVVCEINLSPTPATNGVDYHFCGPAGVVLPELLEGLPEVG
ncbi:MAG: NAD-dependent deacylase [Deltaproteobacteria bacterium]|nr:MAG: NAD-dependent deacylase [Deltaproteobacteria bacterium]